MTDRASWSWRSPERSAKIHPAQAGVPAHQVQFGRKGDMREASALHVVQMHGEEQPATSTSGVASSHPFQVKDSDEAENPAGESTALHDLLNMMTNMVSHGSLWSRESTMLDSVLPSPLVNSDSWRSGDHVQPFSPADAEGTRRHTPSLRHSDGLACDTSASPASCTLSAAWLPEGAEWPEQCA